MSEHGLHFLSMSLPYVKERFSSMADGFSSRKHRTRYIWAASLLLLLLSMSLSACGVTLVSVNCVGQNVSCNTPSPTPNRAALVAAADTITKSNPLLSDPLSKQDNHQWGNQVGDQTSCSFQNGAYVVTNAHTPGAAYGCDSNLHYGNVAIQMDVTLLSGDEAGILFRVDPTFHEMYAFEITNQREADLRMFGENGITNTLIPATVNNAIHAVGQKNRLLVIANGSDFQLFVNGIFIGETHDSSLTTGSVGMTVSDYSANAQASFSNLVIYPV